MEFQWYEYEVIDKKNNWTRIIDLGECRLQDEHFRLRTEAIDYLEMEAEDRFKVCDNVYIAYDMEVTKLGRNLYMCAAKNFRGNKEDRPWALIRVRKHIAKVPMNIVDEYFEKTYKRTGEE